MMNIGVSVTLILIALVINLLGVYKDVLLPKRTPRWFLFLLTIPLIMAAALQIFQDIKAHQIDEDSAQLVAGINSESAPRTLTPEEEKLAGRLREKVAGVEPGKSKLFVAPDISSSTFFNLGLLAFNQRNFSEAEYYLDAALKADQANMAAFNLLLQLYQAAAMNHLQDGEKAAARQALINATGLLEKAPPGMNLRTYTLAGYIYKTLGQLYQSQDKERSEQYWQKAGVYFKNVLDLNGRDPGALNGLGNVLFQQGKLQEALQMYEKALRIAPTYAAASHDAAMVCERLMNRDLPRKAEWRTKAIEFWERFIELSRDDPQISPEYADRIRERIRRLSRETP